MQKSGYDRRKHGSPHTINYGSSGQRPPSPKVGKKSSSDGGTERSKLKQSSFSNGTNRKSPTSAIYENER